MREELETVGFALKTGALSDESLGRLLDSCASTGASASVHHESGFVYGMRGLLWSSASLRAELDASGLTSLARVALGRAAFPIDAIFFDKQKDANFSVPGHQDRLMPVASGCVPAKKRRGKIDYAEPAEPTLAALVALRVHFDDVGIDCGALEVVPGSHRLGVLATPAIREVSLDRYRPCIASRGDVLAIRPLLLHRSGRRTASAGHRRILHVVYATDEPKAPLRWRSSA